MKRKSLFFLIRNVTAWVLSLIMFMPLYLVVINSLKSEAEAGSMSVSLPSKIQLENYLLVIEKGKLVTSFLNSLLYASASTVICVSLAAMAAYVLSRNRTRFNRFIYFFIIMGIALPMNFVTLMKVMQFTHLINTQLGIIILLAVGSIPFNVFLIYGFISSVPREMDESAIVDGCSPFKAFAFIIFPLLTPVIVTLVILNFMGAWGEFVLPLYYLNDSTKWPMTLAVYNFFGMYEVQWNMVTADIVLTTLPVILVYLLGQKYIISGMTAGSVKE